jgi:serine/threonine protein kinase
MPLNVGTLGLIIPFSCVCLSTGGFSYVYLVKEQPDGSALSASLHIGANKDKQQQQQQGGDDPQRRGSGSGSARTGEKPLLVLKVTSIHSRSQRDIAEKEAKLLSRLSHPSIVKMHDACYRQVAHTGSTGKKGAANAGKDRPQHLILMEHCEGGHALDVCNKLASQGQRFDLSTLIIAFGQICNAVSYLHAQRPPIVHRDLKPNNFLVKSGAYKLCDFGSAVFGHVDLRTPKARADAEEVIEKTTTQMFRAPEMVDLYTAKKLTQA